MKNVARIIAIGLLSGFLGAYLFNYLNIKEENKNLEISSIREIEPLPIINTGESRGREKLLI